MTFGSAITPDRKLADVEIADAQSTDDQAGS